MAKYKYTLHYQTCTQYLALGLGRFVDHGHPTDGGQWDAEEVQRHGGQGVALLQVRLREETYLVVGHDEGAADFLWYTFYRDYCLVCLHSKRFGQGACASCVRQWLPWPRGMCVVRQILHLRGDITAPRGLLYTNAWSTCTFSPGTDHLISSKKSIAEFAQKIDLRTCVSHHLYSIHEWFKLSQFAFHA